MFDRAAHCRRIATLGGRATVARYGHEHMRKIGRLGFEATTRRHFRNEIHHKLWLVEMGYHVYWRNTGLPMKYTASGYSIWPEQKPVHPAHEGYVPF